MGYQDRDYFQKDSFRPPDYVPPIKNNPPLIFAIVCFTVGLFHTLVYRHDLNVVFDLSPAAVFRGQFWGVLIGPFASFEVDIFFHAISVYFISKFLCMEDRFKTLLIYYSAFGILASIPFYLMCINFYHYPTFSSIPGPNIWIYSTSGCWMVIAVRRPRQVVHLFFLIPVQMRYFVGGLVFVSLFYLSRFDEKLVFANALSGLSCLLLGFIYAKKALAINQFFINKAPSKIFAAKKAGNEILHMPEMDVKKEVDRLLDKIAEKGLSSLSEKEKQFLKKSSSKYK